MSMVSLERPDVSGVNEEILAYIEALEEALAEAQADAQESSRAARAESALEPSEPPTTMNVISISAHGLAKRTPRHLYLRQRRGGMGIFDLDAGEDDHPAFLTVADESTGLILVTNQGRALRTEVSAIVETEIRGRGQSLLENFPLRPGEMLALVFPDRGLLSDYGQRTWTGAPHWQPISGQNLQPGTMLYNTNEGGAPAAACWSSGNSELFIVTRQGRAIRFSERQVPVRGCLGLRLNQAIGSWVWRQRVRRAASSSSQRMARVPSG
ncbi:MAG: DNA gyrase C-terminal beta-propeller domain-containing protein [Caldilineaceae bacterium]